MYCNNNKCDGHRAWSSFFFPKLKLMFIIIFKSDDAQVKSLKGVGYSAIACIGCKTYFFRSLSIRETLKNT